MTPVQIIVATTTAFLVAGRFGLAPTVKRGATAGLKLVEDPDAAGLKTGDPAGELHILSTSAMQYTLPASDKLLSS